MSKILIVGLGNPGQQYQYNIHNLGFLLLDYIANQNHQTFKISKKLFAQVTEVELAGIGGAILLKPETFMNLSGKSVLAVQNFYKINIQDIIVVHDDVDLNYGTIKAKLGGGNAGHNGLKSISNICGNNYKRIRIGCKKNSFDPRSTSDYVLSNLEPALMLKFEQHVFPLISELLTQVVNTKFEAFNSEIGNKLSQSFLP
jgi:PTH1 family peptidyl-tRNA hydrolase